MAFSAYAVLNATFSPPGEGEKSLGGHVYDFRVHIVSLAFDHPDAQKLIADLQQEYVTRYGEEDATPVDPAEFAPPDGHFYVGYLDGVPVACAGWRAHSGGPPANEGVAGGGGLAPDFEPGDAEMKRMYVVLSARGKGLSRVLLAELEDNARTAGRRRMVLETGTLQPEAISLYTSSGYTGIPKFGHYRHTEESVCFAKLL